LGGWECIQNFFFPLAYRFCQACGEGGVSRHKPIDLILSGVSANGSPNDGGALPNAPPGLTAVAELCLTGRVARTDTAPKCS
jgi:hypothetical protein